MKVKALQGDTVDLLCFRHYGTTQGVTEQVLAANPGLSNSVFLEDGRAEAELSGTITETMQPAQRTIPLRGGNNANR